MNWLALAISVAGGAMLGFAALLIGSRLMRADDNGRFDRTNHG